MQQIAIFIIFCFFAIIVGFYGISFYATNAMLFFLWVFLFISSLFFFKLSKAAKKLLPSTILFITVAIPVLYISFIGRYIGPDPLLFLAYTIDVSKSLDGRETLAICKEATWTLETSDGVNPGLVAQFSGGVKPPNMDYNYSLRGFYKEKELMTIEYDFNKGWSSHNSKLTHNRNDQPLSNYKTNIIIEKNMTANYYYSSEKVESTPTEGFDALAQCYKEHFENIEKNIPLKIGAFVR